MSSGLMDTGLVQLTAERIPITGSNQPGRCPG